MVTSIRPTLSPLVARIEAVVAAARRASQATDDELPPSIEPPEDPPGSRARALADALGLERDEVDFMWSVVARAIDPRVGAHLQIVFGTDVRRGLAITHHAAMFQLSPTRVRTLLAIGDPRHPLRAYGLVEVDAAAAFDVHAPWRASPRLWSYLDGSDELDPRVAGCGGLVEAPWSALMSPAQLAVVDKLASWLASATSTTIVLDGAHGSGRRTAIAIALGRPVVAIDFARVSPASCCDAIVALRRETLLRDAVPVLANLDELMARLAPGDEHGDAIARALDAFDGPVAITTSAAGLDLGGRRRRVLRASWPLPDVSTRRAMWLDALGERVDAATLDLVAERYTVGIGDVTTAARGADQHAADAGRHAPDLADIVAGVQDNIVERIGEVARRVEVRQAWAELVLPPDTTDEVRALIARVRHAHVVLEQWGFRSRLPRGSGVAALFSGPPGTGKTMVAGLIARELQLELYQVDLSRVVSKWVGETEKQLARVFDAAEAGNALLLFDEADALFAKRSSEVKSAVDRYANLEVNYLLQRVESFGGTVILTTNLDASIDPALRRRLASHIVFGVPDTPERVRLWQEMLRGAPVTDDVDVVALADEFTAMTGANIRNAVLAAAFLAADDGATLDMDHLRRGARGEYRAMGRVFGRDDRRAQGSR